MQYLKMIFDVSKVEGWSDAISTDVRHELSVLIDSLLKDTQNGSWVAGKHQRNSLIFKCVVNNPEKAAQDLITTLKEHWMYSGLVTIEKD